MEVKDIKFSADDDLAMETGDLEISASESTHIQHLLLTATTHWRHDAMLGIGIHRYLKTSNKIFNTEGAARATQLQLEYDSWQVENIDLKSIEEISINASKLI